MRPTFFRRAAHASGPGFTRPITNSHPHFAPPSRSLKMVANAFELSLWWWIFYMMKENFAVKLGWRKKFQDLGHPFDDEGLKGGMYNSWLARRGLVKNPGGDVY